MACKNLWGGVGGYSCNLLPANSPYVGTIINKDMSRECTFAKTCEHLTTDIKCPFCGEPAQVINGVILCDDCGYRERIATSARQKQFIEMAYKIGMDNGWCSGRYAMQDGDFITEEDRLNRNSFTVFADIEKLKVDMANTNWCLGSSFIYHDLCFMNQVDGGGEWLTIKRFGNEAIAFESISMHLVIKDGEFENLIRRLEAATKEQCRSLNY